MCANSRKSAGPRTKAFRFRDLDHIGAAAAEDDLTYLRDCFVDTGALSALSNCGDSRSIIVGRTGTGKTALLLMLKENQERIIDIAPESLALSYISNSTILQFFSSIGVKLDIFFKLLWRHVFVVEILKQHFRVQTNEGASFLDRLQGVFKDKKHKRALAYLEKWGQSFWQETEYRIKEITKTLETDLSASLGTPAYLKALPLNVESARKLTEEQRAECLHRAQSVVNAVQIRELSDVLELIDQLLDDPQKQYFLVIDRLDEAWIEDSLRYRLIRALVETVRDFRAVHRAKVVVALRLDLLERVYRLTRDSGFQEEKYESLYLNIGWTKEQLQQLIDRRVNFLIRQRYTKQVVVLKDVSPPRLKGIPTLDYFLARSFLRPRDVIDFLNQCISLAVDKPKLTTQTITAAEGVYSRNRLRSLADEWQADYPNLIALAGSLRGMPTVFRVRELSKDRCEEFCLRFCISDQPGSDLISGLAKSVVDCVTDHHDFWRQMLLIMYKVSLVGLKLEPHEHVSYSFAGRRSISSAELHDNCHVTIHPMFERVLGASSRASSAARIRTKS